MSADSRELPELPELPPPDGETWPFYGANQMYAFARAALAQPREQGSGGDAFKTMRSAFVVSRSCGPDNLYELVFSFRNLDTLQAAHREWVAAEQPAKGEAWQGEVLERLNGHAKRLGFESIAAVIDHLDTPQPSDSADAVTKFVRRQDDGGFIVDPAILDSPAYRRQIDAANRLARQHDQHKETTEQTAARLADSADAKLPRYGLQWNGPREFVATPMADGYWTPRHLANELIEATTSPAQRPEGDAVDRVERAMMECYMDHDDYRITTTLVHDMAVAAVAALSTPPSAEGETGADHLRACKKEDCERCAYLLSEHFLACDGPCNGFMRKDDTAGSYDPENGTALCEQCTDPTVRTPSAEPQENNDD